MVVFAVRPRNERLFLGEGGKRKERVYMSGKACSTRTFEQGRTRTRLTTGWWVLSVANRGSESGIKKSQLARARRYPRVAEAWSCGILFWRGGSSAISR